MNKLLIADIDSNVGYALPPQPEKQQITGLEIGQRNGKGVTLLMGDRAWNLDSHPSIGVVNQATAIQSPG